MPDHLQTETRILEFSVSINVLAMRLVLLCAIALLVSACGTVRGAWDKTTDIYEAYIQVHINPKPQLDLQRDEGLSKKERTLAMQFSAMDQQMELLMRTLAPQDTFPTSAWFNETISRFPWLTAIIAVDTRGRILTRHPDPPLKHIQVEPLLEREWSLLERGLQGFTQDTPLGPELIIAGPFFRDGTWQGLLVAHFDPRSLIGRSPNPDNLVLLTPKTLLWSGLDQEATSELTKVPWEDILKGRVQGHLSTASNAFVWISRPIGSLQLVYAVAQE